MTQHASHSDLPALLLRKSFDESQTQTRAGLLRASLAKPSELLEQQALI